VYLRKFLSLSPCVWLSVCSCLSQRVCQCQIACLCAWRATILGVAKSQTRLSDWTGLNSINYAKGTILWVYQVVKFNSRKKTANDNRKMVEQISDPHLVELYTAIKAYVLENIFWWPSIISSNNLIKMQKIME